MSALWWLLLAGGALAGVSTLVKLRKVRELPDVSDEEFLRAYRDRFNDGDNRVLKERKTIAEYLTVPYEKLSPAQTFEALKRYTGFTGEYEMGMSSLGEDLEFFCNEAKLKMPDPFPITVGEFIREIIRAKELTTAERPRHG